MAENSRVLLPVFLLMLLLVQKGESVWLNLPRSGNKCVTEEIHNNVVVVGDYVVISDDHLHPTPTISAKVIIDVCVNVCFTLLSICMPQLKKSFIICLSFSFW